MSYQFPPDLEKQLQGGHDLAAIQEAIADLEAGDRGKPFDEFVNAFRQTHQIPKSSSPA